MADWAPYVQVRTLSDAVSVALFAATTAVIGVVVTALHRVQRSGPRV